MNGPSSMRTLRSGCVRTIFPASLPLYFAKSASFEIWTRTTSPVIVPFVPDDHSCGKPMIGWICGSVMCAVKRTSDHPLPNAHRSWCAFVSPHSPNFFIVHSLAR